MAVLELRDCRVRQALVFQRKSDFDRHLPVGDFAVFHMAAGFDHFEPVDVAQGLAGLGDGGADRILDVRARRAGEFDVFVDVVAQADLPS